MQYAHGSHQNGSFLWISDYWSEQQPPSVCHDTCNIILFIRIVHGFDTMLLYLQFVCLCCNTVNSTIVAYSGATLWIHGCTDVGGDGSGGYFSAAAGRLRHIVTL